MVSVSSFTVDTTASPSSSESQFGYDAADNRGRRRQVESRVKHEDQQATIKVRRSVSAQSQDLARNFELAAWAIRKHLDYVASFNFQAKTKSKELNDSIEKLVKSLGSKARFETSGKHNLRRAIRIIEGCRVKDSDNLLIKVSGGRHRGRVQGIEAHRIDHDVRDIPKAQIEQWIQGVRVDSYGRHLAYSIVDFDKNGRKKMSRFVAAKNCIYHGFFERWEQTRGVSPFVAALNRFRDTYEGFEYAHAKLKLGQLFGLEIYRGTEEPLNDWTDDRNTGETSEEDDDSEEDDAKAYEFDLNGPGPFIADMDEGDRVGIIESKTPSTETVAFLVLAIQLALKSLDIPFSFFDESFTNFYGSRGGLIQYLKSCKAKIEDLQELLNAWTRWRLGIAAYDGELVLPAGMEFDDIEWEWVPDGVPWWDSVKEGRGAAMAIAMGASSPQRECRMNGTDFFKNVDETAVAIAYAESKDVSLTFADSTAFRPEISTESDDGHEQKPKNKKEKNAE